MIGFYDVVRAGERLITGPGCTEASGFFCLPWHRIYLSAVKYRLYQQPLASLSRYRSELRAIHLA